MRRFLNFLVQFARQGLHTLLGVGPCCRFTPCCSVYSREAIRHWGILRGVLLTGYRLSRCHPLGGWGWDPVPLPRTMRSQTSARIKSVRMRSRHG